MLKRWIKNLIERHKDKLRTVKQYSKEWLTRWQFFCMFWISVYLIADIYYNQATNSMQIVDRLILSTTVIIIPYFAKSFFGKKEEENNKIKLLEMGMESNENRLD